MASNKRAKRTTKRKPSLKDSVYARWQRQVDRLRQSIHRIEGTPSMHGEDWVIKQVRYFKERLALLIAAEPPKD